VHEPEDVIPQELDTPVFRKAWLEWLQYRCQIKKPLKDLSRQKKLNELKCLGPDRAIDAINCSIANGWQGIHEPNNSNHQNPKPPRRFDRCDL
jgi:hypothetical protein